jgi:hypothetical protein
MQAQTWVSYNATSRAVMNERYQLCSRGLPAARLKQLDLPKSSSIVSGVYSKGAECGV